MSFLFLDKGPLWKAWGQKACGRGPVICRLKDSTLVRQYVDQMARSVNSYKPLSLNLLSLTPRFLLNAKNTKLFLRVSGVSGGAGKPALLPPPLSFYLKVEWTNSMAAPILPLINEADVIERILRHLGIWEGVPVAVELPPPFVEEIVHEPYYDDIPYGNIYSEAAPF